MIRCSNNTPEALLIERQSGRFEIPKGHIELGETAAQTALRETQEETGLLSEIVVGLPLGAIEYSFQRDILEVNKRVEYFAATVALDGPLNFGPLPQGTRSLIWTTAANLPELPLISEELRPIILSALLWAASEGGKPAKPQ